MALAIAVAANQPFHTAGRVTNSPGSIFVNAYQKTAAKILFSDHRIYFSMDKYYHLY